MELMVQGGGSHPQLAAFDRVGMVVVAPDGPAVAGRVIDAARGKAPHFVASAAIAAFLAGARARRESIVMTFDFASLLGMIGGARAAAPSGVPPFMFSLGFADHRCHFRLGLPSAALRAAVNAPKP
jgi:hypothetical protein